MVSGVSVRVRASCHSGVSAISLGNNWHWCIAGSAPGTPCTMDSSSPGHDAVGALACAQQHSDVTRCILALIQITHIT